MTLTIYCLPPITTSDIPLFDICDLVEAAALRHIALYICSEEDFYLHYPTVPHQLYHLLHHRLEPTRGWHQYFGGFHIIMLIKFPGSDLLPVLRHELTHCYQSEILGEALWDQVEHAYHDLRQVDPFELQAYLAENENPTI